MRDPKLEIPYKFGPKFLTHCGKLSEIINNYCCLKPVNFGGISYTALGKYQASSATAHLPVRNTKYCNAYVPGSCPSNLTPFLRVPRREVVAIVDSLPSGTLTTPECHHHLCWAPPSPPWGPVSLPSDQTVPGN